MMIDPAQVTILPEDHVRIALPRGGTFSYAELIETGTELGAGHGEFLAALVRWGMREFAGTTPDDATPARKRESFEATLREVMQKANEGRQRQ